MALGGGYIKRSRGKALIPNDFGTLFATNKEKHRRI